MNETPIDPAAVVAEISNDANRQRVESSPAAIDEAEIIAAFDDLAPAGALRDDGAATIARLGSVAHINVDVPTGSNQAALVPVKKGLRKLQAWYLRYVTDQVNVALALATGALEDHEKRLDSLDSPYTVAELGAGQPPTPSPVVVDIVAESIAGAMDTPAGGNRQRTLSAWCGGGEFIAALVARHVDAYGVDTDQELISGAIRQGLDARHDNPVEHLSELPAASLGGLVMGPAIDIMRVSDIVGIIDLARHTVAQHAMIVIAADTEPIDSVRFELAERKPLSIGAWLRLLAARHIDAEVIHSSPGDLTVFAGRA